jgi:hypothetical protein
MHSGGSDVVTVGTDKGMISTVGYDGMDYKWQGTVQLTPCTLVGDASSGGWAKGVFAGGQNGGGLVKARLTLTGNLWAVADPGNLLVNGGTILVAEMMVGPGATDLQWVIEELTPTPNKLTGQAFFTPVGGYLGGGVANPAISIGDFRADFVFSNSQPANITNFGSQVFSTLTNLGELKIAAVPEPASIMLLTLGGAMLGKRCKRRQIKR